MRGNLKDFSWGNLYYRAYNFVCGSHPYCKPWHFQWHFMKDTHKWQKEKIYYLSGAILDVGCGDKPYQNWFNSHQITSYKGLDIIDHENVDLVVTLNKEWDVLDNSVDGVLVTQSLEHLEDINHVLREITRVLKSKAYLLITVPFIYPEHGAPYDFRRFTTFGLKKILELDYEILELTKCGKMGSVLATIILTSIENNMNYNFFTRFFKGILLPFWVLFSFMLNIICQIINYLDVSNTHYCNTCVWVRKK